MIGREIRLKSRLMAAGLMVLSCVGWTQQAPDTMTPKTALAERRATTVGSEFDHSRILELQGELKDRKRRQLTGVVGVLFAIYEQQEGGAPLWQEVQNIEVDKREHFTAMVGSETPGGISPEQFSKGKPCWLGILVMQPGEVEQPRMRLASTPSGLTAERAMARTIRANSGNLPTPGSTQEASGETTGSQPDQSGPADGPPRARRRSSRRPSP